MDIPRLISMNQYWADNPPIHLLVKAFMGVKSKTSIDSSESSKENNEEAIEQLMSSYGKQDVHKVKSARSKVRMI